MVIVREMAAGRAYGEGFEDCGSSSEAYGDPVLNAGGAEVPRIETRLDVRLEARLEEVVVAARRQPVRTDVEGFMARLYLCQE